MLTVITGPPCGGKSTYAAQHARPGDVVIDFDLIAQALGSPVDHGHDEHLSAIAAEARHAAITEAIGWHRRGRRVWVVDTRPGPKRAAQYRRAGASFVTCAAPPEELHRRADESRPPGWHARIDEYLAKRPAGPEPASRTRW